MKFNIKLSIILSMILLRGFIVFASENKIDSLRNVLLQSKEDSNKVKALNTLSWELSYIDPDSAMRYCQEALQLAQKINWTKGIGGSLHQIAWVHYQKGDYFLSMEFNQKAISLWDSVLMVSANRDNPGFKNQKLKTLNNLGLVFWNLGEYPKAIDCFFKALKIEEELGNNEMKANTLNNIGLIYLNQEDYAKALTYFNQAKEMAEKYNYKLLEANVLANTGTIYYHQSESTKVLNESMQDITGYTKALENFLKAIELRKEIGDQQGIASDLGNVGSVYFSLRNYPKAIEYDNKTLEMAIEFGDKQLEANTLGNLGSLFTSLKQFDKAEINLHKALQISDSIGDLQGQFEINKNLSELYTRMGRYEKALESYKRSMVAKDSLFNMNKANEITRKEMNFEFDKKEAKTKAEQEQREVVAKKELQRQKLLRNSFVSGFIIMMVFAGIFFKQRNKIKLGKKHSDELLLNILPAEVAEELKEKGSAEARQFNNVTVMFTDFKNFTQISEKLSPSELVAEIDYCFKAFDHIIDKYKIEKIKTIGDSYMAAGGLTANSTVNASDVVQAAIEIQQFILELLRKKKSEGKEQFEIRIGIHTGTVVAGIVGVKKFAYDIWGDTVNIASRMESSSETGKINISGSTYELVKDQFTCSYRGKIDAKNKGMIDMYFVES